MFGAVVGQLSEEPEGTLVRRPTNTNIYKHTTKLYTMNIEHNYLFFGRVLLDKVLRIIIIIIIPSPHHSEWKLCFEIFFCLLMCYCIDSSNGRARHLYYTKSK